MSCYSCNYYYYDECEGCETCHYEQEPFDSQRELERIQEELEVELWLANLAYDEPDHLAWLEELDIEEGKEWNH